MARCANIYFCLASLPAVLFLSRSRMPSRSPRVRNNGEANKLSPSDRPVHDWYRFVLSFPPHLVRDCIERFGLSEKSCVLDPFCGTGTTVVECKKLGINTVGLEANPMPWFASHTKLNWSVPPRELLQHAQRVAEAAQTVLEEEGITDLQQSPLFLRKGFEPRLRTLPEQAASLILANSIGPLPLHKTL